MFVLIIMSVISSLLTFLFTTIVWFAGKKTISTNSHANQWKHFYTTYNNYRKFYKMYKEKISQISENKYSMLFYFPMVAFLYKDTQSAYGKLKWSSASSYRISSYLLQELASCHKLMINHESPGLLCLLTVLET